MFVLLYGLCVRDLEERGIRIAISYIITTQPTQRTTKITAQSKERELTNGTTT